jgi:hypothetical protein
MNTLGAFDDGLRPLYSFLQLTATLESHENNSGSDALYNGTYKELSPEILILANQTVVYNNKAQASYERRHFEHALWSLENAGNMDKALNYCIVAHQWHDVTEDDFRASLLYNLGRLLFILDHSTAEAEHALRCSL